MSLIYKGYIIQQISTKLHLPSGRSRGFTHDEPTGAQPPRIFFRKRDAQAALRCWLQGEWSEKSYQDSYTGEWDYGGPEPTKKRPDRKAEDMEVVEIEIHRVDPPKVAK